MEIKKHFKLYKAGKRFDFSARSRERCYR
ncbi:hypothetical protein EFT54_15750 [Lacticaseibacillus paracasei]|nr:hypothetical protein [Lacticaseibacillus paracasei]